MDTRAHYGRPPFEEALAEWKQVLRQYSLATDIVWILDENLCFEKDTSQPSGMKVAFQTKFTPQADDVARRTYEFFSDYDSRIVFYRVGSCRGQSVCMILCDPVFDTRGPDDGFVRRDEWLMSFHPGEETELEEVTDAQRWKGRVTQGRPLTDMDFCLPLDVLRELDAHGRPLEAHERFGVRILDAWDRWNKEQR